MIYGFGTYTSVLPVSTTTSMFFINRSSSKMCITEKHPNALFQVNNVTYKHGYYLVDGIYPEWATLVKVFTCQTDDKRKKFKTVQELARKDIERAFGVLIQCWHIIHHPARAWHPKKLRNIIYTCIILHNMILEE